jgi:predicted ATPase
VRADSDRDDAVTHSTLAEVRFLRFKALRDARLSLRRLTVLVGQNAVGKSAALDGLPRLLRPGATLPAAAELEATLSDGRRFGVRVEGGALCRYVLSGYDVRATAPGLVARPRMLPEKLAAAHYSEQVPPRIGDDGSGLASVLQYVQGLRDGTLEAIEADLAAVLPEARRIRTLPARVERGGPIGVRFEVEWEGLGWLPAEHLSDGALRLLGLATVARFVAPWLLLLDDVEAGLHPVTQRRIAAYLRRLTEETPGVQVVATSHSPCFIDELRAEEVVVVGRGGDGGSVMRRLDEHPTARKRGGYLRPGELWSLVGEAWVSEVGDAS